MCKKIKHRNSKAGLAFIIIGTVLVLSALGLACYNLWDDARAQSKARQIVEKLDNSRQSSKDVFDYKTKPDMEMPIIKIAGNDYIGILKISKLDVKLPVISRWSESNLKISPCRYSGSAYTDNLVIAAHNYNSHFGRIKNLSVGDTIMFTDTDGNVFKYKVGTFEVLEPDDIDDMKNSEWDLTLFTCTFDNSYRTTVRCERIN